MKLLRNTLDWMAFGVSALVHAWTGKTPTAGHEALIRLFCASGGRSNDLISQLLSWRGISKPLAGPSVLGDINQGESRRIARVIDERGYYVFPQRLPMEMCDRLLQYGLHHPCEVREEVSDSRASQVRTFASDRRNPAGVRYDFAAADLLANEDVQVLLCDPSLIAVSQAYLRTTPIADVLGMWWHTAYSDTPSAAAAQLYHFDMDRIKWLKFFIYLTDVGPDNGPHSFVAGSHRADGIPRALLSKGYARLTDDEVRKYYCAEDIVEFADVRGTVIVEDTRGLHKGKHVAAGDRLMLQLQFSNSLFGGFYQPAKLPREIIPQLRYAIAENPAAYKNYF